MAIRKILLPLTGAASGPAALRTACLAAGTFHAHLACVHIRADSRAMTPLAGEGLSGAMIEDMMQASERESTERAGAARALFDACIAEYAIAPGPAPAGAAFAERLPSAEFSTLVGREDDVVAQLARLADLTVVPHPEADEDLSSSDALHAVLFDSGRPVLIAPTAPPRSLGERVAVAWNGTAECTAALMAALPWLARAKAVRVLESDEYYRSGPRAPELLAYLELHGVRADVVKFGSIEREVGAGLLAAARDFGADLLTTGAYSHSRIRQLILGGVTRYVLQHSALPVLMNR